MTIPLNEPKEIFDAWMRGFPDQFPDVFDNANPNHNPFIEDQQRGSGSGLTSHIKKTKGQALI